MRLAALLAVAAASCGDNIRPDGDPLEAAANIIVVGAAGDTDRIQPDLDDLVAHRTGVTVVYLQPASASDGTLATFADAAGADVAIWRCGTIEITGHAAEHCHLAAARVSVISLGVTELDALWRGDVELAGTYDRDTMAEAVAQVITASRGKTLRLLDPIDPDAATADAAAVALVAASRVDFAGPTIEFAAAATRAGIGIRGLAHGKLTLDHVQCVAADAGGTLSLIDCASAPSWSVTRDGRLHLDDRCMQTLPTDELVVGACGTGARFAYRLDDAGRIWTGAPPIIGTMGIRGSADCLFATGGRVRAHGCTRADTAAWSLDQEVTHATTTLAKQGRALRLADLTGDGLADLCEVDALGLRCAAGDGHGAFAAPARIDAPGSPLAIQPESLAIGDVDGDGLADACGHVASGILCALAADAFAVAPWSSAFDLAATVAGTAVSFAIADADAAPDLEICALATPGVLCVRHDGPTSPPPLTSRPAPTGPVWIADLDGDHRADWCTLDGPALICGRGQAGVPFDFGGAPPAMHGTIDTTAFADLDGDGFADRCTFTDAMRCARGQGYGFGPEIVVTGITGAPELGDLDGDGVADLCTDAGDCAR